MSVVVAPSILTFCTKYSFFERSFFVKFSYRRSPSVGFFLSVSHFKKNKTKNTRMSRRTKDEDEEKEESRKITPMMIMEHTGEDSLHDVNCLVLRGMR